VRGVTFDGPGSKEMIMKLLSGKVGISDGLINNISDRIISYISAPNLVNCTNSHLGTVYTLFPELPELP
jgi:hypothetical protein